MTVGKDVSMLLADVVKNGQTENLELKKLVYLYLINYAKSQPDLAILAVNTFVKARKRKRRRSGRRLPLRTQHARKRARSGLVFSRERNARAQRALCCAHTRRSALHAQDSMDPNPLIRALAVRTMGCIRVDKITEYLCDPLLKTLRVRVCVRAFCVLRVCPVASFVACSCGWGGVGWLRRLAARTHAPRACAPPPAARARAHAQP
jgi:hypothetical protein